jgi:hypothetical protein
LRRKSEHVVDTRFLRNDISGTFISSSWSTYTAIRERGWQLSGDEANKGSDSDEGLHLGEKASEWEQTVFLTMVFALRVTMATK